MDGVRRLGPLFVLVGLLAAQVPWILCHCSPTAHSALAPHDCTCHGDHEGHEGRHHDCPLHDHEHDHDLPETVQTQVLADGRAVSLEAPMALGFTLPDSASALLAFEPHRALEVAVPSPEGPPRGSLTRRLL